MRDLTVDSVRAHIAAGTCPFCGAGPYAMLPIHTNKAHGVDKWALRDLAHLSVTDPLCSPEARAKMREAYDPARGAAVRHLSRNPRARRTRAGIERNTASVRAWAIANPEAYRDSLTRARKSSAQTRSVQ